MRWLRCSGGSGPFFARARPIKERASLGQVEINGSVPPTVLTQFQVPRVSLNEVFPHAPRRGRPV